MKQVLIKIMLFVIILSFCQSKGFSQEFWSPKIDNIYLNYSGNVGLGTSMPVHKLTVEGKIHAEKVKIDLFIPWPDYVFREGYNLRKLDELEKFIILYKHLPEVPPSQEMEKEGISLSNMTILLQKKTEELTLYLIEHE